MTSPDPVPAVRPAGRGATPVTAALALVLDDLVRIPGTRYRVGLDPVIGLVPVVGDAVTTVVAAFVMAEAIRNRVPVHILFRMGLRYVFDAVLGVIPFVGDVADAAHKATARNLRLLDKTIAEGRTVDVGARGYVLRAVGAAVLTLLALLGLTAAAVWVLLRLVGLI